MTAYLLRRVGYGLLTLLGVNVAIFVIFFLVNPPDAMARRILGEKASIETIEAWKREHGYHLPHFRNPDETGWGRLTQTIFFQKSMKLFWFDFGRSDRTEEDIATEIRRRIPASLSFTVPIFVLSLFVNLVIAMFVAFYRGSAFDGVMLLACVLLMSISALFYIIGGQFLFGIHLKLAPISGYDTGLNAAKFLILPILVGVVTAFGQGVRFNRTIFLEEIGKDYVRTARAKGLSETKVLFVHTLKNAMIPILTAEVMRIPFLFMGSLLIEAFFAVPGLGGYTIGAIDQQDFAVVRAMVYLGALLYIVGQILTDVSYTLVDPRVRLDTGSSSIGGVLLSVAALFGLPGLLHGLWKRLPAGWKPDPGDWNPHTAGNVCVALAVLGGIWFVCRALPREPWRTAWKQLRERRGARAALIVLTLYAAVGLLDSVSWRDPRRDPATGAILRDATGQPVLEPKGLSVLDRLCKGLKERREKTYSAPLARHQYTREMVRVDGHARWDRPPLAHPGTHLLGTDRIGDDVLYKALKGVRTGLLVGGLTIAIAIPIAIALGVLAGYFGGWVDDMVQYLYTVIASIPSILLIVAFLMFARERSLFLICFVLGITSWTGLCRLVRAETLKLRELEYAQAAQVLGASRLRILARHIVPNLFHIVTISAVLQFSGLVLYEAVLAYIGVGVGADTGSWGNMITVARLELSRDPVVWWNLAAAFVFMLGLVLPANLFGDALRDALDPRLRRR